MDVVLTSFGLGMQLRQVGSPYHRMPPVTFRRIDTYSLDHAALLMFRRAIVDEQSYQHVLDLAGQKSQSPWLSAPASERLQRASQQYRDFLAALRSSGRLEVTNFESTLSGKRDQIEGIVRRHLRSPPNWLRPLEASLEHWTQARNILYESRQSLGDAETEEDKEDLYLLGAVAHDLSGNQFGAALAVETLRHWKKKQQIVARRRAREILKDYLTYVETNLLLSAEHDAAFIDWGDMQPFYEESFRTRGLPTPLGIDRARQSRQLFDILFPCFVPRNPRTLARAMDDKRVDALRDLVDQAIQGRVQFDHDFAVRTLKEVLRAEQQTVFRRRVVGWLSMPLGLIPWAGMLAEKASEEIVNRIWSERPLANYRWFYLINDMDIFAKSKSSTAQPD